MSNPRYIGACLASLLIQAGTAHTQPECRTDWVNQAAQVQGLVFGTNEFSQPLDEKLTFTLIPDKSGWHAQMVETGGDPIPTRPVARGVPPVKGENHLSKSFVFGPAIMDPARNPDLIVPGQPPNQAAVEPPVGSQGRGHLTILEQGYAEGAEARMVYMKFQGCVHWNEGPRDPEVAHYASPEDVSNFPAWVLAAFEDCGLPDTLLVSGRMPRHGYRQPAWLEPDLDGDRLPDLVALVTRPADGRHGLATCFQADRRLIVSGLDTDSNDTPLSSGFLEQADWWSVQDRSIVIGIEGAGSQIVVVDEAGNLQGNWQGD